MQSVTNTQAGGRAATGPSAQPVSSAVVGASGYVGRRLVVRLSEQGQHVRALARHPGAIPQRPGVEARSVDVRDIDATTEALEGVRTAYYLVHAMADGPAFAERDREGARRFARAARRAGVARIVYVGALGRDAAESEHLTSRHEVGDLLRASGIPVVELRAAVVLGSGSISFEMLRYLTERLPVMVCPRWVRSRLQPLAEVDLMTCLVRAADVEPGIYELGTPDETTYLDMMRTYARIRGLRPRWIVTIPILTPALSAHWVDLVTPVNRDVSHSLVESLRHDVVVQQPGSAAAAFGIEFLPVAEALDAALATQAARVPAGLFARHRGLADGIYTMAAAATVSHEEARAVRADLHDAGGDLDWYGIHWAWRLRLVLGRILHEHLTLVRPSPMAVGADVDWWRVAVLDEDSLVLASRSWRFGDAWLGYRVGETPGAAEVTQVAAFRPKGVAGLAYWRLLWPVHLVVLRAMVRHRRRRVTRPPGRRRRSMHQGGARAGSD